jgi:hypothetical protein
MQGTYQTDARTTPSYKRRKVPVGTTPVHKYATWSEHREAMRRAAETRR